MPRWDIATPAAPPGKGAGGEAFKAVGEAEDGIGKTAPASPMVSRR